MTIFNELISGLVAFAFGVLLLLKKSDVHQTIINIHYTFFVRKIGLSDSYSNITKVISNLMILFLGICLVIVGIVLLYKFIIHFLKI